MKHCQYPTAAQTLKHGLQNFSRNLLPAVRISGVGNWVAAAELDPRQLSEMVRIVSESFALREPMLRHLSNPTQYSKADLMASFIFECVVKNSDALNQSIALIQDGKVVGGAFNETLVENEESDLRADDALGVALEFLTPIFQLLNRQQIEARPALFEIEGYQKAFLGYRVGHHFMVARSQAVSGNDAFCLVAGSVAHYKSLGFEFMVTEATNNWTGAAMEALGGVRVHFAPYRLTKKLGISPDGYLSDKDSGSMLYVLRL